MATTGFWPVKGQLKDVIDYARNLDKTTEQKYLDDDLYQALRYAVNDSKTDRRMYVSAINCPKQRAYESMMATKRRFGKLGGNVAYHGYQSFAVGEVTPEEAHRIGLATAKRMWGKDYEVVVTTQEEYIWDKPVKNYIQLKYNREMEMPRYNSSDNYKKRYLQGAMKDPEVELLIIPSIEDVKFSGDFDYAVLAQSPNYTPESADFIMDIFREYIDEL